MSLKLTKLGKQFFKFSIVGISSFAIDYTIMILLTSVVGINYLISATVSFSISIVFNYLLLMRYVFIRRDDISRKREFITFVVLSLVGLFLNDAFMYLGTSLIDIDYRITKLFVAAIVSIYNFTSKKIFLENKSNANNHNNV